MSEQIIVRVNPDTSPTGTDLSIVNAARKSFGRRSEWELPVNEYDMRRLKDKDKRLLEFLARGMTADDFDKFVDDFVSECDIGYSAKDLSSKLWQWRNTPTHDTPFNHGFFSFEIKAPIFVARHLVKHEYLIMSEYSRRYITDDVEFYTPDVWRKAAEDVKQGSSDVPVELPWDLYEDNYEGGFGDIEGVNYDFDQVTNVAFESYKKMLELGVAPEQARMILPQSLMTSWTWSGTLGAFANMCKLRLSTDTQYETRLVAQAVYEELKKQFPVAAPLLVEGVYS